MLTFEFIMSEMTTQIKIYLNTNYVNLNTIILPMKIKEWSKTASFKTAVTSKQIFGVCYSFKFSAVPVNFFNLM